MQLSLSKAKSDKNKAISFTLERESSKRELANKFRIQKRSCENISTASNKIQQ